ncbi:hypothetical protein LINPERPRIM_LOCUS24618 [Linum perenne]
MWEELSIEVD